MASERYSRNYIVIYRLEVAITSKFLQPGEVETNYIKRIEFADVPVGDGANGTEITMAFKERYFEKYDIFKIDKTF